MSEKITNTEIDPLLEHAVLTIDGKEYRMVYSFFAIALAENMAKCNLLSALENLTNLNAQQLLGLTYAGMKVLQPNVTMEEVGKLIRLDTIGPVTMALAEAYSKSLPASKKNEDPNANPSL